MNLYLDSTSLLEFASMGSSWPHTDLLDTPSTRLFSSNLTLAEVTAAVTIHEFDPISIEELRSRIFRIWTTIHRIPVDDLCLSQASTLMSQHFVSLPDAIHLASASRVPHPKLLLTLNQSQTLVAQTLEPEAQNR